MCGQMRGQNERTTNVKGQTGKQLLITRSDYDLAFYVFLREIQLYLLPDLFLELKSQYFSTQLSHCKGMIVFADKYRIFTLISIFNESCQVIDCSYILRNLHRSKVLIPVTRNNNVFAIKLLQRLHVKLNCSDTTFQHRPLTRNITFAT